MPPSTVMAPIPIPIASPPLRPPFPEDVVAVDLTAGAGWVGVVGVEIDGWGRVGENGLPD